MGHFKDLILLFREFQSLAPLKAKERCPVDRRHKGMSKAPDDRVCLLCTWERSLFLVNFNIVQLFGVIRATAVLTSYKKFKISLDELFALLLSEEPNSGIL